MQSNLSFFLGSIMRLGRFKHFYLMDEMITEILGEPTTNK